MISDAKRALTQLGFRPAESAAAVERAAPRVGRDATLESLIRAALRACPRSSRT
jgi:Holliday junction resolvasome RuvABC DNA-binding subunit